MLGVLSISVQAQRQTVIYLLELHFFAKIFMIIDYSTM